MSAFWLFSILSFFFGTVTGSFLNVVVWRIPRGESVVRPPSHCPKCGHSIRPWENIPIISWLCLRGRCSGCGLPISIMYPLGEAAVGALYWLIFWKAWRDALPWSVLVSRWCFAGIVLSLARIDQTHRLIPRCITRTGIILAACINFLFPDGGVLAFKFAGEAGDRLFFSPLMLMLSMATERILPASMVTGLWRMRMVSMLSSLLAALIVFWLFWLYAQCARCIMGLFRKKMGHPGPLPEPIGGGDFHLAALVAAFLGADATVLILCSGSILAIIAAILLTLWHLYGTPAAARQEVGRVALPWRMVPLGPYVAVPALLWMIL